jgi:dTDP-4-dehydrorhamnose 3,5-epimerase
VIKESEANKQQQINEAEGEAEAILAVAEATAEGGLHYQEPNPQGKLVRVISGSVFDVAVDIRQGSPTFAHWTGVELSAENKLQLWIPPGFAHGFSVTSDSAEVLYKCTTLYQGENDRGIIWNDPEIGVDWKLTDPALSPKDAALPLLRDVDRLPEYGG